MAFDLNKELAKLQKTNFGVKKWDGNKPYTYWRTQITHSAKGFKVNIHSDGYLGCKASGKTIEETWKNAIAELSETIKEVATWE